MSFSGSTTLEGNYADKHGGIFAKGNTNVSFSTFQESITVKKKYTSTNGGGIYLFNGTIDIILVLVLWKQIMLVYLVEEFTWSELT